MIPDDELLDKLGDYYSSEYVRLNKPEILKLTFTEWLQCQGIYLD